MKPKGAGVIYLQKERFQIYTSHESSILEFSFPQNIVHNLCVIDKELLEKNISDFITKNKISPTTLLILIGDNAASITDRDQESLSEEEKKFHKQVPEEQLIVRKMHPAGRITLFATNKELYEVIQKSFEKQGFTIESVLPAYVFPNNLGTSSDLTLELASAVFKDAISLKAYDLLADPLVFGEQETTMEREANRLRQQKKLDVLRLYAMANVFGVLIIALLVVWNITHTGPSQTYQGRAGTDQIIMPDIRETKYLTVRITSDRRSLGEARELKEALAKYNFESILINRQVLNREKNTLVVFSSRTSPTVRSAILMEVKKYAESVTFMDDPNAAFDISINLK